jgi:acetylornithine deacetylase/succinyl-diaminopimelate desuccinylase-like protein
MTLLEGLVDLAVAIQQIPSPTSLEGRRADFVLGRFLAEGLQAVELDPVGNVYARWPGEGQGRPLVISAHLDTVFPSGTDLGVRREAERISGPGIGDNSLGVAGLCGVVWALKERNLRLPGDVWLVANVGEEGLGNLRGMKAVVERFGNAPLAYLVLEGMALGQIYHRGLAVRRDRITVRTPGGHSWIDYGRPSAVHELTALAAQLTGLKLPADPRTTLNVGTISGGTSVNTIAAEASLELDLRSEKQQALEAVARAVEETSRMIAREGVDVEMQVIGERPAGEIPAEHPLVKLAQDCLRGVGLDPNLNIGSTDANLPLSRGLPALTVGLTSGGGAHTLHEFINLPPLAKGLEQVVCLVSRVWG